MAPLKPEVHGYLVSARTRVWLLCYSIDENEATSMHLHWRFSSPSKFFFNALRQLRVTQNCGPTANVEAEVATVPTVTLLSFFLPDIG